jgi:hypothetical protein
MGREIGVRAAEQQVAEALDFVRCGPVPNGRGPRRCPIAVSQHQPGQNLRLNHASQLSSHPVSVGLLLERRGDKRLGHDTAFR